MKMIIPTIFSITHIVFSSKNSEIIFEHFLKLLENPFECLIFFVLKNNLQITFISSTQFPFQNPSISFLSYIILKIPKTRHILLYYHIKVRGRDSTSKEIFVEQSVI